MNERVKRIQERLLVFWNKYNAKQKTIVFSVVAVIVIFVIILAVVLTRPKYEVLVTCTTTTEAAGVRDVLNGAGIKFRTSSDGLVFEVQEKDYSNANIELGANEIPATGYTLEDAISGGFSATEADKEKGYKAYLEERIKKIVDQLDYVKASTVTLNIPNRSYSVLNSDEETSVSVTLDLTNTPDQKKIQGLANYLATAVGNPTTGSVTIIDTQSNLLFLGETADANGHVGGISTQNDLYELRIGQVVENITKLFAGDYSSVNISPFLDINFDATSTTSTTYDTGDREQGPYSSSYEVNEEGSSGAGGVVGTDSNDEDVTTYEIQDGSGSTSTYELKQYEYKVNETTTSTTGAIGKIDYGNSSVAIVLNREMLYSEAEEREKGSLEELSWTEFKAANEQTTEVEVDEEMIQLVAYATGFDEENISIRAYEVPKFQDEITPQEDFMRYLTIILAVVIFGLLGFVVWRSLRPVEVTESEPELSVEALLSSTKAAQTVEEIDLNDKSETRIAIEKFVDENPEAVALLLRNWLNEDWG